MVRLPQRHGIPRYVGILMVLLFVIQVPMGSFAAPAAMQDADQPVQVAQASDTSAQPAAPNACPDPPADLPDVLEYPNYCVYYQQGDESDYDTGVLTEADAILAAGYVEDYWNRYATDFGFQDPLISDTKLEVRLIRDSDCNGSAWENYIRAYVGCYKTPESIQKVIGHELFHRVQFGYDADWNPNWSDIAWFYEGTARAMEDNAFDNIDNWPTSLTAVSSSFNKQVNTYLASTNNDITSSGMSYNSCLWWKYFTEQFGSTPGEPELGVDAFLALWQAVLVADDIAAVNTALAALGAGTDFDTAFRRFAVANLTKDLTGVPDDSYNFVDEEQAGNPAVYGPVYRQPGGTIQMGDDASWDNQLVRRYGISYYKAEIGADCPVISASFHNDDAGPAFYHVVTQENSTFRTHVEGSGTDWTQAFLNDGITEVTAIVGSLGNSSHVDVTLECADPVLDLMLPNAGAVARVEGSSKFLAQVLVTNGDPDGPVVAGLTNGDFTATVNGSNAPVTGGGFIQEQYWLVIQAPAALADGLYDLEVTLEDPGGGAPLASDTEADSIEYTLERVDHVLVIDRSGSMGMPIEPTDYKLLAAKDAARFYVDITRLYDGLAVVPYNHNVSPEPFDMAEVNSTVRNNAKAYINDWSEPDGIYPSGATSIGDGLDEAVNQRSGSPTGNPHCSFVLLSDGMENSSLFWSDVQASVQATGCPVTAIAFGPDSNEALMQDIAADTGGLFFYNDVYVSAAIEGIEQTVYETMTLELGSIYEYAQERSEGRQRLVEITAQAEWGETYTHEVTIDDSVSEAVFALNWYGTDYYNLLELKLIKPDGTVISHDIYPYTFPDPYEPYGNLGVSHVGWRIPNPQIPTLDQGTWQMVIRRTYGVEQPEQQLGKPYQVLVSGQSNLTLELLLPDRLGTAYFTGNSFPIYAILSDDVPIPNETVEAIVTAPGLLGCPAFVPNETVVPLFDDGQHGDNQAGDGVYANTYTRLNCAQEMDPPVEEEAEILPTPQDEGAYRVRLQAMGAGFQREALGSFSALGGPDGDGDGLPDPWEEENGVDDPDANPDLDCLSVYNLTNLGEYYLGTDPNNSDSDSGGENDISGFWHSQDSLDPADDQIEAPDFFQAAPGDGEVLLTYDVKDEYTQMFLYRAESPDGPWFCNISHANLPLDGAYSDPADNGTTYYYRLIAVDADGHWSATLSTEGVTPSIDPVPPRARVLINGGASSTAIRPVTLSFIPYETVGPEVDQSFEDIVEALIGNDPALADAQWQPIDPYGTVPWTLGGLPEAVNRVYVRFRDQNGNESVGTEVGMILYDPHTMYLPMLLKSH